MASKSLSHRNIKLFFFFFPLNKQVVQGTLLYIFLYGAVFISFQSFSKFYVLAQRKKAFAKAKKEGTPMPPKQKNFALNVKYYNTEDMIALMGDRTVGNTLEQSVIFLPLLWMHAIFVDPSLSFTIASIYCASRALYLVVYPLNFKYMQGLIGLSTGPGYLVTVYLFYEIAAKFVFA